MMKVAFTILGEAASKANSRQLVKFGNRPALIKSEKAREYEKAAAIQIPAAARVMFDVPVRVTMKIYYASERPDLDESVILDVLQAKYERRKGRLREVADDEFAFGKGDQVLISKGVYINDRLVREKHVFHSIDKANPRAEIEVEPIAQQLFQHEAA